MFDTYQFYETMEENNILLLFKGNITSDLVTSILQMTENRLDNLEEDFKVKKKIFNVLVECLQNVYHHKDVDEVSNHAAILMLGKKDNEYFIVTGNVIASDKAEGLDRRLNKLNSLSKDELKQAYQDVLANKGFSEKGGAGLGFIDILRKSGQKLEYIFQDIDGTYSFFSLKVKISNNSKN